jgi:hypothetical protein
MSQLMSGAQLAAGRATALWALGQGQAEPLHVGPQGQILRVVEGWLWLTADGALGAPAEDIWLAPGEEYLLHAGSRWVVEARHAGRFQLLLPRQARQASAWRTARAAWRRLWRGSEPACARA